MLLAMDPMSRSKPQREEKGEQMTTKRLVIHPRSPACPGKTSEEKLHFLISVIFPGKIGLEY